jgi:CubicO group peptidase (beta-lactamase class C family)
MVRQRTHVLILALCCVALFTPTAARGASGASALIGVWGAQRNFGPELFGGEVVVTRLPVGWEAAIAGQRVSTRAGSAVLTFAFKDGDELWVRPLADGLSGQWVQHATVSTGYRFATPVRFEQTEDGVWSGQIHPLIDLQHMWLIVRAAPDGSVVAFLRNPESNAGARWGNRGVVVSGEEVRFVRNQSPDAVGHLDGGVLSLAIAGFEEPFEFRRSAPAQSEPKEVSLDTPLRTGDGWLTGTLEDAALDRSKIAALLAVIRTDASSASSPYIQSLQIARHGMLVVDEYFNGFSIYRPHDVRSAGKSVTTLLMGRIIEDGAPIAPASRVLPLLPQYAPVKDDGPRKQAITIADLMTMSSGLACDDNDDASVGNEDVMQSQTVQPDWYKYTLDLPMAYDPGSRAVYCSAGINLLGAVIARQTKLTLQEYFYERFAAPMRFGPYAMWLGPPPLSAAYMGGGDYFLPRDFLKFGELFLEHGSWNGRPIIDAGWLAASAQPRSGLTAPGDYGYGWHLSTYSVGGRAIRAISAGGNGGQLLYVFPDLDMAVMITAANYGQYPVWQKFATELVPNYIIAAAT